MTTKTPAPPGDKTLIHLARTQSAPLFRVLNRPRAFEPLVVLLVVLPAVLSTFGESVTAIDAAWGLRALAATGSDLPPAAAHAAEALVPHARVRPAALWLGAEAMWAVGPVRPYASAIASLLGGTLLLALLYPLAVTLGGRRFALWAMLLAAFHPTLIASLRDPVPVTVAVALAVVALWGHVSVGHRQPRVANAAALALAAGVCGGLLLVGQTAAVVPMVIVADAALTPLAAGRRDRSTAKFTTTGQQAMARRVGGLGAGLLGWLLLGTVVPSESEMLVGRAVAPVAEQALATGENAAEPVLKPSVARLTDPLNAVLWVGPLWGLVAVGMGRLFNLIRRRAVGRSKQPVPRLLAPWLILGGAAVLWTGGVPSATLGPAALDLTTFNPPARYAVGLTVLPLLLLSAYAIEEAARKAISWLMVGIAIAVPLAMQFGSHLGEWSDHGEHGWLYASATGLVFACLLVRVLAQVFSPQKLFRWLLMCGILLATVVSAAQGVQQAIRCGDTAQADRSFTRELRKAGPAGAVVLLADDEPPIELLFELRAADPAAALLISSSWQEASARLERRFGSTRPAVIVAAWGSRDGGGAAANRELISAGRPLLFAGHELLLYTVPSTTPEQAEL